MPISKILLVDDSETQVLDICDTLKANGFDVVCKTSAESALEYLDDNPDTLPDVIITDILMPGMDGYQFCQTAKEKFPGMFVVVLTIMKSEPDIQRAFDAGATEFIAKPLRKPELLMRVKNVFRIKQAEDVIKKSTDNLFRTEMMLGKLTDSDALSGLFSRSYMGRDIGQKIYDALRYDFKFSAILIYLDDFKKMYEIYGFKYSDSELKNVAGNVLSVIRKTDVAGRFDEFTLLVLLPNTGLENSIIVAEKIRKSISSIKCARDPAICHTASFGVLEYHKDLNIDSFISRLESLLEKAKESGSGKIEY